MKKIFFSLLLFLLPIIASEMNAKDTVRIDVLYFHATIRCQGCLTIEEYTKNSVYSTFEKQLKDSTVTLSSLDFLQPENEHYQTDYKFETQTLIISMKKNGKEVKWKNLDKIWDFLSNYQKFQKYIEEEINKFLNES